MSYNVKCTHIVSQLKNIKKYENYPLHANKGEVYIEVYDKTEYMMIREMELNMGRALWYYQTLIEETSK